MKIGFSLQEKYDIPMPEALKLLRKAGFDAVSLLWKRDGNMAEVAADARACGFVIQSLHGPIRGMQHAWSKDLKISREMTADLLQAAEDCAALQIPVLVVHAWYGKEYTFREEDLYFGNFETLVKRAEELGVQIAFENLEGPEYLAALMEHFADSETAGMCWDAGHELCYNPGWDLLGRFGQKLLMTHLNDNLGLTDPGGKLQTKDDLHLMAFDGKMDWEELVNKLKRSRKQEILNFELKIRPNGDRCALDLYSHLPLETFFATAYESACRALKDYFI